MAKQYAELYAFRGRDNEWVLEVDGAPLDDDDGKMRTWETELDAFNELATEGWELVTGASQSEADHPERTFLRFFLARERPSEGGFGTLDMG